MSDSFRKEFFSHLEKHKGKGARDGFMLVAAWASVISLVVMFVSAPEIKDLVLTIYVLILLSLCIVYIFIRETRKRHRFASSVTYLHFVNHAIRDYLSLLSRGREVPLSAFLTEILDAISANFSIVTGKPCRASVKDLTKELEVITMARDSISNVHSLPNSDVKHKLSENTDFEELWYGKNGNVRTFIENNLQSRFQRGAYKNSSFKIYGEPTVDPTTNDVIKWTLPYKSTIVLPIRFIEDFQEWPPTNLTKHRNAMKKGEGGKPHFWGFLCVDCESKNVFDEFYASELGAAYADALYVLLSQSKVLSDSLRASGAAPSDRLTLVTGGPEAEGGHNSEVGVEPSAQKEMADATREP